LGNASGEIESPECNTRCLKYSRRIPYTGSVAIQIFDPDFLNTGLAYQERFDVLSYLSCIGNSTRKNIVRPAFLEGRNRGLVLRR
jgi:hypothetical protein